MQKTSPDFFIHSELVCIARENLIPELSSGVAPSNNLFAEEKEKLRNLFNACEQYCNK